MEPTADSLRFILGLKVKGLRHERGYSLADVSRRSGLSVSYLSEIESGRKYPKPDKLLKLARALSVGYEDMVSLEMGDELDALKSLLGSELVQEFPFELFGVEARDVLGLLSDDPAKASAMIRAFLEVGRTYDMQVEHFLFAALRAYQQLHGNHFEELEKAASDYRRSRGWPADRPPELASLRTEVEEGLGTEIDEETLPADPDLEGFRSVFVEGPPPRLLINGRLKDSQKAFVLAREIGFRELGVTERAHTSSWLRVRSFEQVLGNFRASYFAGALMIDADALEARLRGLFSRERWDEAAFRACLADFGATPEMFFYRLTQTLPERLGLGEIFFLRFHSAAGEDRYRLTKVLNMSRVPVPHGIGRGEHYCRRWQAIDVIREAEARGEEAAREPVVRVQRSRFFEEESEFLVISVARPLALQQGMTSSVSLGFLIDDAFRRTARFVDDPAIPRMDVSLTCERCPLVDGVCDRRAAPPLLLRQQEAQRRREAAVERVLREGR